ncbi:MAG TPA: MGMT family protein [Bacteroidales bacterium]|nr:MGMT family protein [Bacteroidales bacterium]
MMKSKIEESFFDRVYSVVREIPYGKVTTYGTIARCIGSPQSARMVGWAMNNSHNLIPEVPAHRVVNRNGLLTGKNHFGNVELMQKLLQDEGIKVINDQIIDFNSHFWDPMSIY